MARVLRITKRGAKVFAQNISNADERKDITTALKYRKLSRRISTFCQPYWKEVDKLQEEITEYQRGALTTDSDFGPKMREFNKRMYELDHSSGAEFARDDHTDGILLENEEFNFLSSKFKELKGIPSEGEAGAIWEEIYEAFEGAEEVKVKAVREETSA